MEQNCFGRSSPAMVRVNERRRVPSSPANMIAHPFVAEAFALIGFKAFVLLAELETLLVWLMTHSLIFFLTSPLKSNRHAN